MVSEDDVIKDAKTENDYRRMLKLREYVERHEGDFPDPEYLYSIIDDQIEKRFMHPDCSQIRNISILTRGMADFVPLGREKAMTECATAQETMNESLKDWLFETYRGLVSFKVDIAAPSSYEVELARRVLPSMEQRAGIRRAAPPEAEEVNENELRIDVADLIRKEQDETRELIDAVREDNDKVIEGLRKEINALQEKIENSREEIAPQKAKEISRILDSSQYQFFLKNAYKLGVPVRYNQIARGQYKVTAIAEKPENEDKILKFFTEAESHEKEISHIHAARENREGYEAILNDLCINYETESGRPCGLSRTGALSRLTNKMLEYAKSQGVDWRALFDARSMDLFAKKGQIYTSEQADEAFNRLISNIQGRMIKQHETEQQEAECPDEMIIGAITDYDAIALFRQSYPQASDPSLDKLEKNAIDDLSRCGFYPNNLDNARDEASVSMHEYGADYDSQVDTRYKELVRRYGGEAA